MISLLNGIPSVLDIYGFINQKGIPCIQVINMKKSEYITYRTDPVIKSILSKIAAEKKWSISQVTEEIIREWLLEKHPELLPNEE